jgi:hypothetical protein
MIPHLTNNSPYTFAFVKCLKLKTRQQKHSYNTKKKSQQHKRRKESHLARKQVVPKNKQSNGR